MAPVRDLERRVACSMEEWQRYLAQDGALPAPLLAAPGDAEDAVRGALEGSGDDPLSPTCQLLLVGDGAALA